LAGYVAQVGQKRNVYMILVGRPEGKRPLGRPRHRWLDDIKMNLRYDGVIWTELIWFRREANGGLL
jgi:hypothetical protein